MKLHDKSKLQFSIFWNTATTGLNFIHYHASQILAASCFHQTRKHLIIVVMNQALTCSNKSSWSYKKPFWKSGYKKWSAIFYNHYLFCKGNVQQSTSTQYMNPLTKHSLHMISLLPQRNVRMERSWSKKVAQQYHLVSGHGRQQNIQDNSRIFICYI